MLSRLVISFLPRSKRLLISWLQSPCAVILEPRKTNSATVSTISPSIYHELMGPDAMILVFWMLSFRPTFSLSSFMFGPLRRPSAKKRKSMLLNWGAGENYKEIKPVNPKGNRSWTEYSLERLMLKLKLQHFAHKGLCNQRYGFSSSSVWMWELDHKEGWLPKNSCFWIVLVKILESPLDCKEIKPVNPKGNQPWIFIERTDAEGEAPILWPPDAKSQLIGKDPDSGKDWEQEKKVTEDEMVGWHHQPKGHKFEQTPGDSEG